eukprot:12939015-Prorocentrum_lima.AAC.1
MGVGERRNNGNGETERERRRLHNDKFKWLVGMSMLDTPPKEVLLAMRMAFGSPDDIFTSMAGQTMMGCIIAGHIHGISLSTLKIHIAF